MTGPESTLAMRLSELLATARNPATGRAFTDRDVGEAVGCSHTLIFNLRKGIRTDANSRILTRTARLFQVDPTYLLPEVQGPPLSPRAMQLAMRADEVSAEGLAMVDQFLNHIRDLELGTAHPHAPVDTETSAPRGPRTDHG